MKLNRSFNQRKALARTQLNALINNGQITTTEAKAKFIKPMVDRLITKAKVGSVHARRQLAATLASVPSANRLIDVIMPLFAQRKSGFTSLTKIKIRKGDATTISTLRFLAEIPLAKRDLASPDKPIVKTKTIKTNKPNKLNLSNKSNKSKK